MLPPSVDENVKVAEGEPEGFRGPERMVVFGGVRSNVVAPMFDTALRLPAASDACPARTRTVTGPSAAGATSTV